MPQDLQYIHPRLPQDLKHVIYRQKKTAGTFDDKYVKYISEGNGEELAIKEYLENIRSNLRDVINDLKKLGEGKFI